MTELSNCTYSYEGQTIKFKKARSRLLKEREIKKKEEKSYEMEFFPYDFGYLKN